MNFRTLALVGLLALTISRVSFGSTDQPSTPQISYECFVISSDAPIQHDFPKLTNQRDITIFTFHKILTRVGKEITVKNCPSPSKQYVIGKTNPITIQAGISITLTGTLDQGKITLIGNITSTETDSPKTPPDSFTLETRSSDLYFSTKTKSGSDVWLDMDRLIFKIPTLIRKNSSCRHHAIRIVPTLIDPSP